MYKALPQLTLDNISIVYKDVIKLIKDNPEVTLDLSKVTTVDSAGVALLCELKQFAHTQNIILNIQNPSDAFLRLCKLYKITLA